MANQTKFTTKLLAAHWEPSCTINDTNAVLDNFIKKVKRIYNKWFPYVIIKVRDKKSPWLTAGILKSIRYKNGLYLKAKSNSTYMSEYKT